MDRSRATIAISILLLGSAALFAAEPAEKVQRRIYVPLEDLDVIVERDQRGVLLHKAEFEKLTALAGAETAKRPKSPKTPFAWTKAGYQAMPVDDQLLLTVRAELEQFAPGWQQVTIPLSRVAVEQAKLDGEPALIARGDGGALVLFTEGAGPHVLELQLTTELAAIGADRVAAFGLVPAPSGTLALNVAAGKRLHVGGWQLPRPAALDQPADYKVAVGGQESLHLRITDRGAEQTADVLAFATTGYGLHVMPGEVSWHALTTLQVFGKPLDRLTISAPNFLEIADVDSSGLESWVLADDPNQKDRTQITLTYRQPFDGERKIHFKGVMATPPDAVWTAPTLDIANVTSHIGQVVVQYPAGVRLQLIESDGVRRATADQQPASDMPIDMGHLQAVEQRRFDFWRPEFTLRFVTQPRQRDVQTAVAAVLDVNSTGLDLDAALTVKTRFAPLFDVDLELPAEWTLLTVTRDGQPLAWQTVSQAAGKHLWRIPLSPPLAVDAMATLQLSLRRDVEGWPVENAPLTVDLPELVLPQSNLHEGTLVVRGDDEFDLAALEVVGLDSVPLKAEYERLRFQSQDTRYSGQLKVTRKPSRVAVESLSFTRLDPQSVHAALQALVEVQGGGVRTLRIELPETVGTSLRFAAPGGPRIVEQTSSDPQNGVRTWTLQFDHRVRGRFLLYVDLDRPRGDGDSWTVPEWKFLDADRQNGYIAIEASGEQRLTIDAQNDKQEKLTEVDPLDLPRALYVPKERIIAVYRTVLPGAVVTLSEQRFDKEAVPTAVCRLLSMTTVAARTGELQHRGEFQLNVVGVQNLSLKLPPESWLWATLVDGKPVEVRHGNDVYLLPLPVLAATAERKLELFYRTDGAGLDQFGTLKQSPPELMVVTGTGADQPVVVLEQHWRLFHPDETLLVDSDGWLEPTTRLDETSWLGRWQERLRKPTWHELGQSLFIALAAVVLATVPILVYRRSGVQGMLFGSGICALLFVGFVLFYSFAAQERSGSAQFADQRAPAAVSYADYDREHPSYAPGEAPKAAAPAAGMAGEEFGGKRGEARLGLDFDMNFPKEGMRDRIQGLKEDSGIEITQDEPMGGEGNNAQSLTDAERKRLESLGYSAGDEAKPGDRSGKGDARPAKKPKSGKPAGESGPFVDQNADGVNDEAYREAEAIARAATDIRPDPEKAAGDAQNARPDRADPLAREIRQVAGDAPPRSDELGRNKSGGLLSLSLELAPPEGSRRKDFRYVGQGSDHVGTPLSLTYAQRKTGTTLKIFLIALFALAAWLQRRSSLGWKIAVTVLGVAVPLGLVTIAPLSWQVLLDGVFFGTLAAAAVWIGESLCGWCERNCAWCCGPNVVKPAALAIAALMCGANANAQEAAKDELSAKPKAANVVVIPYEAGTNPTAAERVFLPHDQFVELWRKAHPDQAAPAPIDGALVEALYATKLDVPADKPENAVIRIAARYAIRSYVDGQWSVTLPLGSVALSSAKLDGKAAIVTPKDGGYVAVIPAAGLHVLDLEFSVPAKLTGSAGQFTVPLKAVPSGKLAFALPAKDLLVRVNGSSSVYRRATKDDATSIEVPVDQAGDLTVAWQPPQAKGGGAAVVHVESVTGATIGDAGVSITVGLNYRVRQGTIQDVSFSFPEKLKLQSVTGADLGGWELQAAPDGRRLRILFRRAVTDQTQLFVKLFLDQKIGETAEEFDLATLTPQEVTNEVGTVAIFAGDQFQISAGQITGLTQIDTATFTPAMPDTSVKVPPRAAYRFSKRPFSATFQIGRQAAQGQLVAQHGVSVMRRKMQSTSRFHYQLTGAPRSSLSFTLPKDFLPLEVRATALADWYVDVRGDTPVLTVQLAETRLGTVEVVITGSRPRDPNATTAEILLPQPLDITRVESTLALWTDESYLASVQSSEGWRAVDAAAAGPELQRLRGKQPIRFAFQSSGTAVKPVVLQLVRGEPKLRADSLVTTTVTEFTVVHALALQWQIDGAAVDSLSLTTPKSLAGRLDFQGNEIREVTQADAGNNRVRCTIWFRTPVSGKYFATALAALPPASDQIAVPAILCEQSTAAGQFATIENQRQYVLLINGSSSQLTLADATVVETVQRDDLPIVVPQRQIDQGTELVRLKQLGTAPAWTMQRFAQTESIPASVNIADLTTVLARDGTYRTQAVYTIKNRRRQFLALRFPENSQLLSVMLQDRPARCVKATIAGHAAYLVALPKTSEADLSFPVKLVVAGRLPQPLPPKQRWETQEIEIPAPQVISQTDDEAFGIPVARTRWTVYLADDLDASAATDPRKHNLTTTPEGAGELIYASAAVQELNELLDVVESSSNDRQRRLAADNMKQLGVAVHNYSYAPDSTIAPQQVAEFNEQQRKVVERFNKVQQDLQTNAAGQTPKNESGPSQPTLNFTDQTDVLNFAIEGNTAVFSSNRLEGISQSEATDETFQFELQQQAVPQSEPAQRDAKPEQQQSDFLTRGAYQRANEANLGDLNARISGRKMQSNSGQGLSPQDVNPQFGLNGDSADLPQLTQEFDALYQQRRYAEAEVVAKRAMQLSPQDSAWATNFWKSRYARRDASNQQLKSGKEESFWNQMNDVEQSTIVRGQAEHPIRYGDDWADLTNRRKYRQPPAAMMEKPGPMVDGPGPGIVILMDQAGAMGGMGGGMGGGDDNFDADGFDDDFGVIDGASSRAGWTEAGGLSLPINLPTAGQKLVYTKTGGDPKLTLSLRPKAALRFGLGFVWTAVWVIGAILLAAAVRGPNAGAAVTRILAWGLLLLGFAGWCLLPAPVSALALIALVAGTFGVVWSLTKPAAA